MLRAAPPAYVVAMVIQLVWIPWRLLRTLLGLETFDARSNLIDQGIAFTGGLVLLLATAELARRTRGRARWAMSVATAANLISLLVAMFGIYILARTGSGDVGWNDWYRVLGWLPPALGLLAISGTVVAAGRQVRTTSLAVLALSALINVFPPVHHLMVETIGYSGLGVLWLVEIPVRSVLLIVLAGAIARQGYPPRHGHVGAARATRVVAAGASLAGGLALALALRPSDPGDPLVVTLAIGELIAGLAMGCGGWWLAQVQHPALPRYLVHAAAALALLGALLFLQLFTFVFDGTGWQLLTIAWWILVPGVVALLAFAVAFVRYGRHRAEVRRVAVIGAAVGVAAAAASLGLHDHALASALGTAIANLAVVPVLVAGARALAHDPVQTTADVFA